MGVMTVEYAIIFPFVNTHCHALIYLGMTITNRHCCSLLFSKNTQDWLSCGDMTRKKFNREKEFSTREGYGSEGLYWQVFSGAKQKKEIIKQRHFGRIY